MLIELENMDEIRMLTLDRLHTQAKSGQGSQQKGQGQNLQSKGSSMEGNSANRVERPFVWKMVTHLERSF